MKRILGEPIAIGIEFADGVRVVVGIMEAVDAIAAVAKRDGKDALVACQDFGRNLAAITNYAELSPAEPAP